jgi:hypothetical protein
MRSGTPVKLTPGVYHRTPNERVDRPTTSPVHIKSPTGDALNQEIRSLRQKLAIVAKERDLYKTWKDNYSRYPPTHDDSESQERTSLNA